MKRLLVALSFVILASCASTRETDGSIPAPQGAIEFCKERPDHERCQINGSRF